MKPRFAITVGALTLGWLAGPLAAADPVEEPPSLLPIVHIPTKEKAAPGPVLQATDLQPAAPGPRVPEPGPKDIVLPAPKEVKMAMPPDGTMILPGPGPVVGMGAGGGCVCDVGILYLKPHWRSNNAYDASFSGTAGNGDVVSGVHTRDFAYDYEFTPRFVVGYVDCDGLGVRARYLRYYNSGTDPVGNPSGPPLILTSATVQTLNISATGAGDQLFNFDTLETTTIDLEVMQEIDFKSGSLIFHGGLRYLNTDEQYLSFANHAATGRTDRLMTSADFDGIGPTVGYEFRRALGHGCVFMHSTRLGIVFGQEDNDATRDVPGAQVNTYTNRSEDRMSFRFNAELEIGLDWCTDCYGGRLFVHTGLVGLLYGDVALEGLVVSVGMAR